MKLSRHKRFRRILRFYQIEFGVVAPYKLLVDAEFLKAALEGKIYLKEQLPKMMQNRCYALVTTCVMNELKRAGREWSGVQMMARRLEQHKCEHHSGMRGAQCLAALVAENNNVHGFMLGAQNAELRAEMRQKAARAPLVYIQGNVPLLEQPASHALDEANERHKRGDEMPLWEKKALDLEETEEQKKARFAKAAKRAADIAVRRRTGIKMGSKKQPNPLSCKSKKSKKRKNGDDAAGEADGDANATQPRKKTRRKRSRSSAAPRPDPEIMKKSDSNDQVIVPAIVSDV